MINFKHCFCCYLMRLKQNKVSLLLNKKRMEMSSLYVIKKESTEMDAIPPLNYI